jgi:hypothetical protein
MSFETDNQDKSNLVGDVMDKAVNVEQERLALIDEVRELKADWSANLETKKALMFSLEHVIKERDELEEKAEQHRMHREVVESGNQNLIKTCVAFGDEIIQLKKALKEAIKWNWINHTEDLDIGDLENLIPNEVCELVSNALESIRGES